MKTLDTLACSIGRGLVAGFAGTAAMTVSSTVEAKLRKRAPSSAPARATAKVLGITEFEDDLAKARFSDLSHWGYGTSWASAGAPGDDRDVAEGGDGCTWRRHLRRGQVTLPALEIAPPSVFWPKEEIAIDAFHHAVYATATGISVRADQQLAGTDRSASA